MNERKTAGSVVGMVNRHVFAELEKVAATGETGETYRYLDVRE